MILWITHWTVRKHTKKASLLRNASEFQYSIQSFSKLLISYFNKYRYASKTIHSRQNKEQIFSTTCRTVFTLELVIQSYYHQRVTWNSDTHVDRYRAVYGLYTVLIQTISYDLGSYYTKLWGLAVIQILFN
jgi:hypothetical protein